VGGDLYDFFMIDQDRLALVIADVSGKGIPAALFMMQAKTLIREIAHQDIPIENIMERVNSGLCAFNEEQLLITTWMMILDLATGKALEVNAGHTKPALCRHEERYSMVRNAHDLPLGIMENLSFTVYEWHLKPGDRIFVYTDGISEAENISEEQFGTERLLLALNEVRNAPEKETLDFVAKSVRAFAGEAPQTDDMTMLGMTYFGETSQ
jgi:serine phosphatase RsbU (regulator of sigma subunit)